jgi:rhodanese-related sulfurtransferase
LIYGFAYRTALRLSGRPAWAEPAPGADPLRELAADIARRAPETAQMAPSELAGRLADRPGAILLLDVRTPAEFAVSHLAGAILATTDSVRTTIKTAPDLHPDIELVVVYCAVGIRSNAAVTSCRDLIGAPVVNLAGGLFRWSNERRPMVDGSGPVNVVHPYNPHWRRFLR